MISSHAAVHHHVTETGNGVHDHLGRQPVIGLAVNNTPAASGSTIETSPQTYLNRSGAPDRHPLRCSASANSL